MIILKQKTHSIRRRRSAASKVKNGFRTTFYTVKFILKHVYFEIKKGVRFGFFF